MVFGKPSNGKPDNSLAEKFQNPDIFKNRCKSATSVLSVC